MLRLENKKAGQAAIELAVFGAILVFIMGTIVRSAANNGYAQNQNFKAMRMAMLRSYQGSQASSTAYNSASVLFIEDRLSPDANKYGDLDRSPNISQGSGIFSYEMLYPMDAGEVSSMLPIMDIYINAVHFPFTTAYYLTKTIPRPGANGVPACPAGGPYESPPLSPSQCLQNQCLRNQNEWGGTTNVNVSQFNPVIPEPLDSNYDTIAPANAGRIFNELSQEGFITPTPVGSITTASVEFSTLDSTFTSWFTSAFGTNQTPAQIQAELNNIQGILQGALNGQYKFFYSMAVNGTTQFSSTADPSTFDLLRNRDPNAYVPAGMRPYVAWQWVSTPATSASSIGLDATSNQYPQYDIDGRLKMVTIYGFSRNADGTPSVTYEDFQGGDIDGTWDSNSCTVKPGLQNQSDIFTKTQNGTYLQIGDHGNLYDPKTGALVSSNANHVSVNKKNTVDLIQRQVQLSNNTGRFCNSTCTDGSLCYNGQCANGSSCSYTSAWKYVANDGVTPNPVEVCAPGSASSCFVQDGTFEQTCYDTGSNIIYVRSRLQDLRGHYWTTDTSGPLSIK